MKKSFLKIAAISIAVVMTVGLALKFLIGQIGNNISNIADNEVSSYFREFTVSKSDMKIYVRGTGQITSFNIKTLDVYPYSTIKNKYKSDGDTVKAKERIMQIATDGYYEYINSPIDGMYFETEENGVKVYQVYDLDNIGLELSVLENDAAMIGVNQKATIKISALNREIEGTVDYISKLPTNGKFKVRIKVPYDDEIRFGYGASAKIVVKERSDCLTIPYEALFIDAENCYYVIKKEDELAYYQNNSATVPDAIKTFVEIGSITNETVEILSGLSEGETIAVRNW